LVLAVAKSSSATVATDQLCGCDAQHRNRSYGNCIIATVAASQVVSVAKLSIATVAAIATDHVAVAKLSVATVAAVTTDQVVLVATPLSQPSQPSQPVNY
jgi:hypothetical protein